MTDTPKPLTADEIADLLAKAKAATDFPMLVAFRATITPEVVQRFADTIEQRDEQIEKLRNALLAAQWDCNRKCPCVPDGMLVPMARQERRTPKIAL